MTGSGGAGPIPQTCVAAEWSVSDGYADMGHFCGFAYVVGMDGATANPPCSDCFDGDTSLCISGQVPAFDDPVYPFFVLGWNVSQLRDSSGIPGGAAPSAESIAVEFSISGYTGPVRLMLRSDNNGPSYCVEGVVSGQAIPWEEFRTECWEGGQGFAFQGDALDAIELHLPSTAAPQTFTNFCLTGVTVE